MATACSARYNQTTMPARPRLFALGLLLCLAGAITCATAPANDPQAFPSRSDGLVLGGLLLVVLGVAGRDPRGRQLLGRRPASRSSSPSPSAPADASVDHPEP
jgi:peptidoglycan/LPS O-acetylase OafA/YrhL